MFGGLPWGSGVAWMKSLLAFVLPWLAAVLGIGLAGAVLDVLLGLASEVRRGSGGSSGEWEYRQIRGGVWLRDPGDGG